MPGLARVRGLAMGAVNCCMSADAGGRPPSAAERAAIDDLVQRSRTAFDPDNVLLLESLSLNKVFSKV